MFRLEWPLWLWAPSIPSPYECILSSVFSVLSYNTRPLRKREVQALLGDPADLPRSYKQFSIPDVSITMNSSSLSNEVLVCCLIDV